MPDARSWFLTISRETRENSVILKVAGRIGSSAAPELAAALEATVGKGLPVMLDLSEVDYLSSAGLHAIEGISARLRAQGKSLEIRGAEGATRLSLDLAASDPRHAAS